MNTVIHKRDLELVESYRSAARVGNHAYRRADEDSIVTDAHLYAACKKILALTGQCQRYSTKDMPREDIVRIAESHQFADDIVRYLGTDPFVCTYTVGKMNAEDTEKCRKMAEAQWIVFEGGYTDGGNSPETPDSSTGL